MSSFVQAAGLVCVTVGCWLLAVWLGLVVGGVLLLSVGIALEQRERK